MQRWVSSAAYRAAVSVLIEERRAKGLSQRALAARLGKPPSFVGKVEAGERKLDFTEFFAVARALESDVASLTRRITAAMNEAED